MIGSEYSPHSLNQSDYILNPTATTSLVFSRASGSLLVFTLFLSFLSDIFLYPDWTQSAWVVFCFRHSIEERWNISTSNSFTFRLQWKLSEKNQDFQNLSFPNELRLIACWIRRCLVGKKMVVPGYCDSNLHRLFPGSYFWVYSNWTVPVWCIRVRKFSKSFGTNSLFCVTSIRWNKRV